jgi:rod shape-determining protein MreD
MGNSKMNWPNTIAVLLTAYVAILFQTWFQRAPAILGFRPDLMPAIVLVAALRATIPSATLIAVTIGFWIDSLSVNPFGISILPLTLVALSTHALRGLVAHHEPWLQFIGGAIACAGVPLVTLFLLMAAGENPLLGPWFLWRWIATAILGGAATPLLFLLFNRFYRAFNYQPAPSTPFRPDREIARGRDPHAHH